MKRENEYLYLKLANILRSQIQSGYIKPGEFLLSEMQLAKHYEMSRVSVRSALDILLKEGLIEKRKGQGTIVSPNLSILKDNYKKLNIMCTYPSFFGEIVLPFIIQKYNEKFPFVKVNVISVPYNYFCNYLNKRDGEVPDLYLISDDQMNALNDTDRFVNIPDILKKDKSFCSDIYKELYSYFIGTDNAYAVPITFSSVYMVYNVNMINRYAKEYKNRDLDLSLFREALKALSCDLNGDGIVDQYGLVLTMHSMRWVMVALRFGVDFSDIENSIEPLIETFKFFQNLLFRDRTAILFTETGSMNNPFYLKHAAVTITSAIEQAGWIHANYGIDSHPMCFPSDKGKTSMLITNCLIMPHDSENQDMAFELIKTALDVNVQQKMASDYHFPSVYKSVNNKVWSNDNLMNMQLNEDLKNVCYINEIFYDSNMMEECDNVMKLFWMGMKTAEETAENIVRIFKSNK